MAERAGFQPGNNRNQDVKDMTEGGLQNKFGAIPVKVIEYQEGALKDLQG